MASVARRIHRWKQSACPSNLTIEALAATDRAEFPACEHHKENSTQTCGALLSARIHETSGQATPVTVQYGRLNGRNLCSPAARGGQPKPKPRATYGIRGFDVSAAVEQQPHCRLVAVLCSHHDRRPAVLHSHRKAPNTHRHHSRHLSRPGTSCPRPTDRPAPQPHASHQARCRAHTAHTHTNTLPPASRTAPAPAPPPDAVTAAEQAAPPQPPQPP